MNQRKSKWFTVSFIERDPMLSDLNAKDPTERSSTRDFLARPSYRALFETCAECCWGMGSNSARSDEMYLIMVYITSLTQIPLRPFLDLIIRSLFFCSSTNLTLRL